MKLLNTLVIMLGLIVATASADQSSWMTDFDAAKKAASESSKPILADFAGSDWCGWCIKLDREVFSKQEFSDYADENLVLFLADFPARKQQSEEVKKQNSKLQKKYGIRGFPTVLLLDADGNVLARTGYRRGGAEKYVEYLKTIVPERPEKDAGPVGDETKKVESTENRAKAGYEADKQEVKSADKSDTDKDALTKEAPTEDGSNDKNGEDSENKPSAATCCED